MLRFCGRSLRWGWRLNYYYSDIFTTRENITPSALLEEKSDFFPPPPPLIKTNILYIVIILLTRIRIALNALISSRSFARTFILYFWWYFVLDHYALCWELASGHVQGQSLRLNFFSGKKSDRHQHHFL